MTSHITVTLKQNIETTVLKAPLEKRQSQSKGTKTRLMVDSSVRAVAQKLAEKEELLHFKGGGE